MTTIGSLCSGIGGFELGFESAIPGAHTIWQVEQDPFCLRVLEKHWPDARRYHDVRQVRELQTPDILLAGFPCQDISRAGRMAGLDGEQSGLFWEVFRIVGELRPRIVCLENVSDLAFRGLPTVLAALSSLGYHTEWTTISAAQFGAPHLRQRLFIVAHANDSGQHAEPIDESLERSSEPVGAHKPKATLRTWRRFPTVNPVSRRDDGIPNRMDRYRSLGNAIVPQCSAYVARCIMASGLLGHQGERLP